MQHHVLENIFPQEIVNIILEFMKQYEATKIIKHYTNIITNKTSSLKFVITEVLNSYNIFHSILDNLLNLSDALIIHLKTVINSNYSREKYNHYFWQCLINILSRSIMNYYNYLTIYCKSTNIKLKKDKNYILLKKTASLWFKLCIKHNISLALYININKKNPTYKFIYVNSKNIELQNFNKLLYAPLVYDVNITLDYMHCKNYLSNYLLIM